MDTLQNMRVFQRVVETGSFTAAAQSFNSTTGIMSRAVTELEAHLRTRLLTRSTRRLALTPAGEAYLARCTQILMDVDSAEEQAAGAHVRPAGHLRIFSYAGIGQHYVLPAVAKYGAQYPDVSIELHLEQHVPDLYGGSDVAVISAPSLSDSTMVSHWLGSTYSILCASPRYLASHGTPGQPGELSRHRCLALDLPGFPVREWSLEGPDGKETISIDAPFTVNLAESLLFAIRSGMGIGLLPLYSAVDGLRDGSLVRVLPAHTVREMNVYVLYPSRRFVDAKTKTWVDFARNHLPAMIAGDHAFLGGKTPLAAAA
jgi:DNA-binding transcriptional LysR family regulator